LMLLMRRLSPSRSTSSARPKLCTTRASARLAAAFQVFGQPLIGDGRAVPIAPFGDPQIQ
jgi:hypothetical protein